jgi:hypothetical protein
MQSTSYVHEDWRHFMRKLVGPFKIFRRAFILFFLQPFKIFRWELLFCLYFFLVKGFLVIWLPSSPFSPFCQDCAEANVIQSISPTQVVKVEEKENSLT